MPISQVNLGHRKVIHGTTKESVSLEKHLENGRNLRKSNTSPIKCEVKLNRVWKDSKHNIETTRHNLRRKEKEGTLPPHISVEPSLYNDHWQTYTAIIPAGAITSKGYVKEVWIEDYPESVTIDNQSYEIINPYVHNTEQWIQGFKLGIDVFLLPSPKIVVKYYHEKKVGFRL